MRRICTTLQKPFFEVMSWPESELDFWAASFSIDDNKDKPTIKITKPEITVEQSIKDLIRVLES